MRTLLLYACMPRRVKAARGKWQRNRRIQQNGETHKPASPYLGRIGGINMEQLTNYVKPELLVLAVVLYFVGMWLKQAAAVKDKYIPLILGIVGIFLCAIWVLATCPVSSMQDIAMAVFTAIVQGILVAGLSTYVNQVIKQTQKPE